MKIIFRIICKTFIKNNRSMTHHMKAKDNFLGLNKSKGKNCVWCNSHGNKENNIAQKNTRNHYHNGKVHIEYYLHFHKALPKNESDACKKYIRNKNN